MKRRRVRRLREDEDGGLVNSRKRWEWDWEKSGENKTLKDFKGEGEKPKHRI